jgi:NitT/TauT family transport system permease protein
MISLIRMGTGWRAVNWPALIFGAAIVSLWEALVRALALSQSLFPPPSYVMWSLYVRFDLLMEHAWPTFCQTLVGFLLSVVLGVALGWIISKSRTLFEALYPVVVVLQVVPKEALAPLLVLWFGAGTLSRTVLAFLIAFFPMVINTIFGVRSLNTAMRDYARRFSATVGNSSPRSSCPGL